jgi:hypothetical protein
MERRQFLQWGTATIVGAAVLGACTGGDNGTSAPGLPPTTASSESSGGAGPTDLTLAKTAASLELMLVGAYQQLAASRLVTNPAFLTLTSVFEQHHRQHLDALNGIITSTNGQPAISAPNDVMENQIVRPQCLDERHGRRDFSDSMRSSSRSSRGMIDGSGPPWSRRVWRTAAISRSSASMISRSRTSPK